MLKHVSSMSNASIMKYFYLDPGLSSCSEVGVAEQLTWPHLSCGYSQVLIFVRAALRILCSCLVNTKIK